MGNKQIVMNTKRVEYSVGLTIEYNKRRTWWGITWGLRLYTGGTISSGQQTNCDEYKTGRI